MADNTNTNAIKTGAPIDYTQGELIAPTPEAIAREQASRERTGVAQIERVMRGEELPADAEGDRARLTALGLLPQPQRGPGKELRVPPGAVVGHATVDGRARDKVLGRANYTTNIYPAGVLYTKVLRSPYPHAKITKLDTSKALAFPGVAAIITGDDVPKVDRPALAKEPGYAGEPIAAVAAESEAIAEEAVRLIEVTYEQLPFVLDPRDALKPGAPLVRSALKGNATRDPQFSYKRGDMAKGAAAAELSVEIEIETSYEQHVAMEPHNATAVWDRDFLTLHSGTQWAHGTANAVAAELGIGQSQVRVVAGDTGSGWGDKTGRHGYHIITALLAKKTGRPVRWELNRKDIFLDAGHNYPFFGRAKLGLKRDGTITSLEGTSYVPGGAYGGPSNSDDWEAASRTYQIPNVSVSGFSVRTNTVNTSPLRGVGEPSGNFLTENLINRAAEAVGMDPVQFRLKNIETKIDQVANLPYSSNALREAIERGAELFNWQSRWKGWKKQWDRGGPQRGIGMVCFECNKGASSPPMTAIVQIQSDGSVVINTGAADIGGGQGTTWSMIVAETLGVPLRMVKIYRMDNHAGPDALGIFGSRGTKSVGTGMLYAALDAKTKLLDGAAFKLKVDVKDLDIKDGVVFRKSDPQNKTFQLTMAQAAASGVVIVDGEPRPAAGTIVGEARATASSGYSQKTFGAGFYEVEVDPATGFVRVIEAVQVHDVGRVINPMGALNQIHGGIMHGINKALTEELIYDPSTGVLVNTNLDEYKLHMIDSVPPKISADFVEPIDLIGPYGAKGLGEPALLPASPAIHAAIYDAIGVRVDKQPMTTSRIMNALAKV